jgi:hypothetical protein
MSKRRRPPVDDPGPGDEFDELLAPDVGVELDELEDVDVPSTIPLKVRRSLPEVLGDEGEHVERVWLEALASENERTRVEAAKVLTQAVIALAKSGFLGVAQAVERRDRDQVLPALPAGRDPEPTHQRAKVHGLHPDQAARLPAP